MTRDRFDDFLSDAARGYHEPPETPRDEIWARLEAARRSQSTPPRRLTPGSRRFRWLAIGAPMGLAAALLLGIAIGRTPRVAPPPPDAISESASDRPTTAVRLAAADHLSRIDALLVDYATNRDPGEVATAARDLLNRTRLWIDADRITDPGLKALLEDLELVLAQIAQLTSSSAPQEREIIEGGIAEREIRPRLHNAIPAGPTA